MKLFVLFGTLIADNFWDYPDKEALFKGDEKRVRFLSPSSHKPDALRNIHSAQFLSWPGSSSHAQHLVVTSKNYVSVINSMEDNKPVNSAEWKPSTEDEDTCRDSGKTDCGSNHVVFGLKHNDTAMVACGVSASYPSC